MEIEHLDAELKAHEHRSQKRFEQLHEAIKQSKPHHAAKEHQMSEGTHIRNVIEPNPMGGMLPFLGTGLGGAGAGGLAGVAGGVLGGLLTRGGLFGADGRVGEGCVTPAVLAATAAQITDTAQNTAVLQGIGDLKGAVPLAEAQVQLAIAGSTSEVISNATTVATAQALASALTNQNIANATATIIAAEGAVKDAVTAFGTANITATKDSQYALASAIRDDGDKTRALITSQYETNLQRQLGVAEALLAEQRAITRGREAEITITNTNTAVAAQAQSQSNQQQQIQLLVQQNALLSNLANDIQVVRQGQVIFNSGTMAASGTQAAANTRVA